MLFFFYVYFVNNLLRTYISSINFYLTIKLDDNTSPNKQLLMKQLSTLVFCLFFANINAQSINVEKLEDDPRKYNKTVLTFGLYSATSFLSGPTGDGYGLGFSGMHVLNDDIDIYGNFGIALYAVDIEPYVQYYLFERQTKRRMSTLIGQSYTGAARVSTYLRTDQQYLMRLGARGGFHHINRRVDNSFNINDIGGYTVGSLFVGAVFNGRRGGSFNAEDVGLIKFATDFNIFADVLLPVLTNNNLPGDNDLFTSGLGWRIGANQRGKSRLFGSSFIFTTYQFEIGQYADMFVSGDSRPVTARIFLGIGFGL